MLGRTHMAIDDSGWLLADPSPRGDLFSLSAPHTDMRRGVIQYFMKPNRPLHRPIGYTVPQCVDDGRR